MSNALDCRLIIDSPAAGPRNMAIDEALLSDATENGVATLRFYQWSEPTLSLGYFQRYEDRYQHTASRDCAVVRRQSGGGAILHDRELTYSLALPAGHPLARDSQRLYSAIHEAFINMLMPLIAARTLPWNLRRHDRPSTLPPSAEPFLCFERRACGDVLLVPASGATTARSQAETMPPNDVKILGSAQRRHHGAILQHGSLLLEKSPAAPELAGLRDSTGASLPIPALIDDLTVRLAAVLDADFSLSDRPKERESNVAELTNRKYGSPAWTKRR